MDQQRATTQRSRHSLCEHCGYYLEGTPIVDGAMRCPECGELSSLSLERPVKRGDRGLGCLLIAALVLTAIGVPLAFMVPAEWRLIGGLAAAVIVLAIAPRALRRVFDV